MKIRIYQVSSEKDAMEEHRSIFREYDKERFNKALYDFVFEGTLDTAKTLDDVFEILNIAHPEGYSARSLSVSDIVEVVESSGVKPGLYYVQSFGFLLLGEDALR